MSLLTIAGVILYAVATVLIIVGTRRDARSDSAHAEKMLGEAQNKLDEIRGEIRTALAQPVTPEGAARLDSIDHQFSEWAADFQSNKARLRLEGEQNRMTDSQAQLARDKERVDKEADLNRTTRPVIAYALEVLKKSVEAHNKVSGSHYTVNLPELPPNLYDGTYNGRVDFGGKARWEIFAGGPTSPGSRSNPPELTIHLMDLFGKRQPWEHDVMALESANLRLTRPELSDGPPTTVKYQFKSLHGIPLLNDMNGSVQLSDYSDGVRRFIQSLVNGQLLFLEEHPEGRR